MAWELRIFGTRKGTCKSRLRGIRIHVVDERAWKALRCYTTLCDGVNSFEVAVELLHIQCKDAQ